EHLQGGGGAGEFESGRLAHRAPATVAADQVAAAKALLACRCPHGDLDAVAVIGQAGQFVLAPDIDAEVAAPLGEHLLGTRLGDPFPAEVRSFEDAEVDRQPAEMSFIAYLDVRQS